MSGSQPQLRAVRSGAPRRLAPLVLLLLTLAAGCDSGAKQDSRRGPASQSDAQGGLFDSVAENLDRLEQFDVNQMLPQIVDRLNQWYLQDKPQVNWQVDPLVAALPDELRNLTAVRTLDSTQYRLPDAWYLQESVWARDISKSARADQFEDVAVAERLFDWTVRNIQLERDVDGSQRQTNRHRPFETLLLGRGQAMDRAWLFTILARQQGLDVVLLGLADESLENVRPWLPALLSNGQLYLFDCRLGLPIPGPGGRGVATLAEVVADATLLRRLDLDAEHPYPVTADELKHIVAYVEATPISLSRRMALVETRLAGRHKMVLTSPASALADRVKKIPNIADAKLWPMPFEIWLWQSKLTEDGVKAAAREMVVFQVIPGLMTGRELYFKGMVDGEKGAKKRLLESRPPDTFIENYKLPKSMAAKFPREQHSQVEASQVVMMKQAKQDASFWLGLVAFQQQDYPVAIDFFAKRTLEAAPKGRWTPAARYNLARTYEASGQIDKAIELYESDNSPQSHGNKLRARSLREPQAAPETKQE